MKIIRQGIDLKAPVRLTCNRCQRVFEAEVSELKRNYDQRDGDFWSCSCPNCSTSVTQAIPRGR